MAGQASNPDLSKRSMTVIKTLTLPDAAICSERDLYFRSEGPVVYLFESKRFLIERGGRVRSNTFFNLLSTAKLRDHTFVRSFGLALKLKGRFCISAYKHRLNKGQNQMLWYRFHDGRPRSESATVFESAKYVEVDSPSDAGSLVCQAVVEGASRDDWVDVFGDGIVVADACDVFDFTLEALEDGCEFCGGQFFATELEQPAREVRILYATTVFRRPEKYQRNEKNLLRFFDERPDLRGAFDFLAVDNGRSLEEGPLFRRIPNENVGSSGGCARAMLEAIDGGSRYTHLIYSDDDILLDPRVLENIYYLLRVQRDENQWVAAAMLRMEDPAVIYEMGGHFENFYHLIRKRDLRVTDFHNLLHVEFDEDVNYAAWWLACFPVHGLRTRGLPLPFFLRMDDIEYGARQETSFLTMSGIAVWHESFESKLSQIANYYLHFRNVLAMEAIRDRLPRWYLFTVLRFLRWEMQRVLFSYRYNFVRLTIAGIEDFLRGPDHVFRTNIPQRLAELAPLTYPVRRVSIGTEPFCDARLDIPYRCRIHETFFKKWLRRLSLCGHLLPRCLCRGRLLVPSWAGCELFLDHQGAVFYDENEGTGYEVTKSFRSALVVGLALLATFVRLIVVWPRVRRRYQAAWRHYTTPEFWRERMEMTGPVSGSPAELAQPAPGHPQYGAAAADVEQS